MRQINDVNERGRGCRYLSLLSITIDFILSNEIYNANFQINYEHDSISHVYNIFDIKYTAKHASSKRLVPITSPQHVGLMMLSN